MASPIGGAEVRVERLRGMATVQDGGRPGRMHEGVPPGGALVPELAARANLAAGNAPGAALIEVIGALTFTASGARVVAASDAGERRELAPGESWEVAARPGLRVAYVAFAGGLAVPRVLGGQGTLLVARLGGHEGRALARGDRIPIANATSDATSDATSTSTSNATPTPTSNATSTPTSTSTSTPTSNATSTPNATSTSTSDATSDATLTSAAFEALLDAPIRVVLGPDLARFDDGAVRALTTGEFIVLPESDRTGVRLAGPVLSRADEDTAVSAPMTRGAIQVPSSGQPILLGPDHPTTGGYPVIAVVASCDLGRCFARPAGAVIRFAAVSLDEARRLCATLALR